MKYLLLLISLFIFDHTSENEAPLRIAVASNAQQAVQEIVQSYRENTGQEIEVIIGSSGKITAQILAGAPYDVFISADEIYPEKIYKAGKTFSSPRIYAYGSLVLWSMKNVQLQNIQSVAEPAIKKIAVANPATAPYGAASIAALKLAGLYDKVQSNLVYGESIAQVNHFILSKTVDAGFTSKSSILSDAVKSKGKWIELPAGSYPTIAQSAVLVKHSDGNGHKEASLMFEYLYSSEAKKILLKYGYRMHP